MKSWPHDEEAGEERRVFKYSLDINEAFGNEEMFYVIIARGNDPTLWWHFHIEGNGGAMSHYYPEMKIISVNRLIE